MTTPQQTIHFQQTIINSLVQRIQTEEADSRDFDEATRQKIRRALGEDYKGRLNLDTEIDDLCAAHAKLSWVRGSEESVAKCIAALVKAFGIKPKATLLEMVDDVAVAHRRSVGSLEQAIANLTAEVMEKSERIATLNASDPEMSAEATAVAKTLAEGFGVSRGRLSRMARDAVSCHLLVVAQRDASVNKELNTAVDEIHTLKQQIKGLEQERERKDDVIAELHAERDFGNKRSVSATEASGGMHVTLDEGEATLFRALAAQHPKDLAQEILILRRKVKGNEARIYDMESLEAELDSALRDDGYDASVDVRDLLAAALADARLGREKQGNGGSSGLTEKHARLVETLREELQTTKSALETTSRFHAEAERDLARLRAELNSATGTSEETDFAFGAQIRQHPENPEVKRLRDHLANVKAHATRQQAELTTIRQLVGAQGKETAVAAVSRYVAEHPSPKPLPLSLHPEGDFYRSLKEIAGLDPSKSASRVAILERLRALKTDSITAAHDALARAGIRYTGMVAAKIDDLADHCKRAAEQRDEYWLRLSKEETITLNALAALAAAGVDITGPETLASRISDLAGERDAWRTTAFAEIEKHKHATSEGQVHASTEPVV
jgi:cell division protein FtsB